MTAGDDLEIEARIDEAWDGNIASEGERVLLLKLARVWVRHDRIRAWANDEEQPTIAASIEVFREAIRGERPAARRRLYEPPERDIYAERRDALLVTA